MLIYRIKLAPAKGKPLETKQIDPLYKVKALYLSINFLNYQRIETVGNGIN
jgi:hypothetical protein